MTDSLFHRGPDKGGFFCDDKVSLGHRRLSIIDLSEKGSQPMFFKNFVIVYNGEIYNFKEIRETLLGEGYRFASETDTEIVAAAYHHWGTQCVEKFNGMWAFCIYDRDKNNLFLSRDRFGVKPLYYYFDGNKFIFSSELKAITAIEPNMTLDEKGLNFFFYQKYIGSDLTVFKNCHKLLPSHNLIFDISTREISLNKFYDLREQIAKCCDISLSQRLDSVHPLLVDAVEKRLIADVPVGSFLSGGIDSSLISAIISGKHKNFDTFSIGFRESSYNELDYSKFVSETINTRHHYEYLDIDENLIEKVIGALGEPFGDSSILPTYLLSQITRKHVTVCLSGDAGDEVFGGYDIYKAFKLANYIPRPLASLAKPMIELLPPSEKKLSAVFKLQKFLVAWDENKIKRHLDWMGTFSDEQRQRLLPEFYAASDSLLNPADGGDLLSIQLNDVENYLAGDILQKVDIASMLNSLEVRVPFLDYRIVPLVLSLPEEFRVRRLQTKWLLKKIAEDYLPPKIIHRKKRGFTVPISRWVKNSDLIREYLLNKTYYNGTVDFEYVKKMYTAHVNNKKEYARQLWLVFVFNYWYNRKN